MAFRYLPPEEVRKSVGQPKIQPSRAEHATPGASDGLGGPASQEPDALFRPDALFQIDAKKSELSLKNFILNNISDMAAFYPAPDMIPAWANEPLIESSGSCGEALLKTKCHQFWYQSHVPCSNCPVLQAFESEKPHEVQMGRPDGGLWNIRALPVFDEKRHLQGVVKICRDVTAHKKAEQAVAESEKKFQLLFHSTPAGICTYNNKGEILECNQKCAEILGTDIDSLVGLNLLEFLSDHDFLEAIAGSLSGAFTHYEGLYTSISGGRRSYLNVDFAPVYASLGRIIGGVAVGEDIIEKVRTEKALRQSEEKYRSLFEGLPVALYQISQDGRVIDANKACLEILRCTSKEELKAVDVWGRCVDPMDGVELWRRLQAAGSVSDFETRLWCLDGSMVWGNITARLIYDENGRVRFIEGSLKDVTERRVHERCIQESEARFRGLAERSSDIIVLFDKDYFPLFWSPSAERILGYSREELMAMAPGQLMTPENFSRLRQYIAGAFTQRRTENFELAMIRKDGDEAIIEWSAIPVHDGMTVTGTQFIGRDISTRKKAEAALRKSHEELRNLSKHLESAREQERLTIAREVHDDLGQSLTAIKFDLAWLRRRMPAEQTRRIGEKLEMTIKMVDSAIQSVKKISSRLRPEILNDLGLAAAMEWYLEDFERRTDIACDARIDAEVLGRQQADSELCTGIFRIFQEALTNVARHSNATEVFVSLTVSDGCIVFLLNDNGKGIEKEHINTSESFGLVGIRERVTAFSGQMHISGIPGKGTTLKVRLPLNYPNG